MVEDVDRSRTDKVSKAPWLKIFSGFKLALDPKKLVLAAAGIFLAYLGWWAISWVFYNVRSIPTADGKDGYFSLKEQTDKDSYLANAVRWTLLHKLAGSPIVDETIINGWISADEKEPSDKIKLLLQELKSMHYGMLRECPWNEDRGPNQFLLVSKIIQHDKHDVNPSGYFRFVIEPLYKFLLPVTFFFDSRAGGLISWNRLYLVAIMFWTIAVWGIFGGAITRMASVQVARNEKVGLREAVQFVLARWQGYVFAPVLPLAALLGLGIGLWFFGLFFGITFVVGDVVGGLLWPITMIMGLIMAVILVGLLGWPLMNATISTEGSDSFDALSRSYSYVYQVPWHCLGYSLVSVIYGAVLVFFVGFMGTLVVYLSNWGIEQAQFFESRDPALLYAYAPTSFEWRDVLLKDSPNAVKLDNGHYKIDEKKLEKIEWYQHTKIGTILVTFWLGLFFLLIIGFSYSFFWTAATIIYLLLRQKVDDTDLDEVYLEEEEEKHFMSDGHPPAPGTPAAGGALAPVSPAPAAPSAAPPSVKFTMVDAPSASPPSLAPEPPAAAPPPPLAPPANPDPGTSPPPTGM